MKLTKQFLRGLIRESLEEVGGKKGEHGEEYWGGGAESSMTQDEIDAQRAHLKAKADAVTPEEMINAGIRSIIHDREGNHSGEWGLSDYVKNQLKYAGGDIKK